MRVCVCLFFGSTGDGRNPSPVDAENIQVLMGFNEFFECQLVEDLFHQQSYLRGLPRGLFFG